MCLGLVIVSALGVQRAWFGDLDSAGDRPAVMLTRWMVASLVALTAVVPVFGAMLAPAAIPAKHELAAAQAEALAGVSGTAMVLGRLIACMRPLLLVILLSAVLWTVVEWCYRPLTYGSCISVVDAHVVVLSVLCAAGGVSALASAKLRGGRSWSIGPLAAFTFHGLSIFALFMVNNWLLKAQNPVPVIQGILLINPVTAVCTCLKFDLLRVNWVYGKTIAPEFDFQYPGALISASLFALVSLISVNVAGRIVGKAVRK